MKEEEEFRRKKKQRGKRGRKEDLTHALKQLRTFLYSMWCAWCERVTSRAWRGEEEKYEGANSKQQGGGEKRPSSL